MSNAWFKKTYQAKEPLPEGIEVGIDQIKIYETVVKEMKSNQEVVPNITIDHKHVKMCLQAHIHNPVTAYYHLLLKKKIIQGEPFDEDCID